MKQAAGMRREFTGRHMLIIMLMFFGVVITVNLIMATFAHTSWTGLVVHNSYVASQEFNEKAQAGKRQSARHWKHLVSFEPGRVSYRLNDGAGSRIHVNSVTVTLRRPAHEGEDTRIELQRLEDGSLAKDFRVRDGIWIVETSADFGEAEPYITSERVVLKGGAVR